MKIAVAGGTGQVGTHVVEVARERGHEVVVLSRGNGVDLVAGTGVADALAGVDIVVDVSSVFTLKTAESVSFFETVSRTLLAAEEDAGVPHHVALSIVGIDNATEGYYAGAHRAVRARALDAPARHPVSRVRAAGVWQREARPGECGAQDAHAADRGS